ncbi:hypothetical protein M406DRAFT_355614 [Cryphonectria parasitica EP155]|uniref:Uncharacterized protein n=1 Tax=Cryphonectria parasitica (strain ATCC 38755 / EP155) TaxID=660469 RepID=A0A9P5CRH8_CRYP1|nr:uncharacterized protein M406DRAFT_355614 [Cryphonectria parasitica EP155]KAF3767552.1 hypothetical protein M406DRAFT_355614 [Cryphonectria parasitica EP155]
MGITVTSRSRSLRTTTNHLLPSQRTHLLCQASGLFRCPLCLPSLAALRLPTPTHPAQATRCPTGVLLVSLYRSPSHQYLPCQTGPPQQRRGRHSRQATRRRQEDTACPCHILQMGQRTPRRRRQTITSIPTTMVADKPRTVSRSSVGDRMSNELSRSSGLSHRRHTGASQSWMTRVMATTKIDELIR